MEVGQGEGEPQSKVSPPPPIDSSQPTILRGGEWCFLCSSPPNGMEDRPVLLKAVTALTLFLLGLSILYPLPLHPFLIDTNAGSDMI